MVQTNPLPENPYNDSHGKIIEYYKKIQPYYDLLWASNDSLAMHYGFWGDGANTAYKAQIRENRFVADSLRLQSSDLVLDAGCGVCGTALWMAQNYGCTVKGITVCDNQIEKGNKFIRQRALESRVSVERRDFCRTGYPDESFTKIFGIESVCYARHKSDFIREAFRLLKPKGRLVVADGFRLMADMPADLAEIYQSFCEGWAMPNLATPGEFKQDLANAGFGDIEVSDFTEQVLPSSRRLWWINVPFYLPVVVLHKFKLAPVLYKDTMSGLNQKKLFEKKIGGYYVFSAQKP